jgi:sugar/nucleoside kinase (ribokinase family)
MTSQADKPIVLGLGELLWDCFADRRLPGGAPANVAFHACQLGCLGQLRGWPLERQAAFANAVGALVAGRPGAMPPLRDQFARLAAARMIDLGPATR